MNWVDLVIVAGAGFGVWSGYRRGALLQVFSWGGFIVGFIAGIKLAPPLVRLFNTSGDTRAIYTVVAMLGIAFLIEGIVAAVALRLRRKITNERINTTDKALGSVIAGILALVGAWMLGATLSKVPAPSVSRAIKSSAILRAISRIAPPAPQLFGGLTRFLSNNGFPEVFAALNPSLAPGVAPPPASLAQNKNILAAADVTYKIQSDGCGGIVDGSGFPVGNDMFITAGHVVAGTRNTKIIPATGSSSWDAIVVYFDPNKDIAVLRASVPGRTLVVDRAAAHTGTDGAAIGYPGGGKRTITPARVRARTDARGYNIYSDKTVTRVIYVLRAEVHQGNSGGPLVDTNGQVRGMIFAAAQDNPDESYALAETEIFTAMNRAQGKTQDIKNRGSCAL